MQAAEEHGKRNSTFQYFIYALFLLLPTITLVLLQTTQWHPNNSYCDPWTGTYGNNGKCTCMVEYPRYMFILAGFEILIFVYLLSDPFTNTPL